MNRILIVGLLLSVPTLSWAQKKTPVPDAGTVFKVSSKEPWYLTADIEFRDPTETKWPNFFFGKPEGDGQLTFDPKKPSAKMTLLCDKGSQLKGEQTNRILGELIKDEKSPAVTFAILSAGEVVQMQFEKEEKGKKVTETRDVIPLKCELQVGDKKVPVTGNAFLKFNTPKGKDKPDSVAIEVKFTTTGKDLGLKAEGCTGPIQVKVSTTAYTEFPQKPKK